MSSAVFETMRLLETAGLHFYIERTRPILSACVSQWSPKEWRSKSLRIDHLEISRFRGDEAVEGGKEALRRLLESAS